MTWLAALVGAIVGALTARKRKGNKLDMLQYAAGFAIAFGLIGLVVNLVFLRTLM